MIDPLILPQDPGCYIFKNAEGKIIYVGKANNIRKRVGSYFSRDHDSKTEALKSNIESVEFFITENEVEALILENRLIKKHQPKYNIRLKDSKNYAYILITDERFPRLVTARNKEEKGSYFGPFVSGLDRQRLMKFLSNVFSLRTCKKLPKRPCTRYHMGRCNAPCVGKISEDEYNDRIKKVKMILSGQTKELVKSMKAEMIEASHSNDFEKAKEIRDQISAIETLSEKQIFDRDKRTKEHIINYVQSEGKVYLIVFSINRGLLEDKEEFTFDAIPDFFEEFIVQYYSETPVPHELIIPRVIDNALIEFLEKSAERNVMITIPKQGEKKDLLDLVEKNIKIIFLSGESKVIALKSALKMKESPNIIECFDISHISGSSMVGSMVQFRIGRPDKRNYRRFKIRTVTKVDDFAAIKEIVKRRYKRLKDEKQQLPNLIIIDGGAIQLRFAREALQELNIEIPIIAIAKRLEEIYFPNLSHPIRLLEKSVALHFIQEIRDEAHRFAIKYNVLLRKKSAFGK